MDDRQLLDEFARNRSQRAFKELVDRHLPTVYSAACRMVQDTFLAEEVAQNVFMTLVQKAETIRPPQVLGGWLYNTTRHLALHAVRSEQRRREREQTAVSMQSFATAPDPVAAPMEIMEHLEPAMAELDARDRDALVLRFLGDRGLRDVGAELGISEEAARKRVDRALERLRIVLQKRSITASTVLLATALAASTVSVPNGLGATIVTSAFGALGSALHASTALAATKTVAISGLQKSIIASVVGLVIAAGTGALLMKQTSAARSPAAPAADAKPNNAKFVSGILKAPDGNPLPGAEVFLSTVSAAVAIYSAPTPEVVSVFTDSNGRFSFPASPENRAVIAIHDLGYGELTVTELSSGGEMRVRPWARVEGTLRKATKALPGQTIHLSRTRFGSKLQEKAYRTVHDATTKTDGAGHYVFPRVAPGDAWVSWRTDAGHYDLQYSYFDIQPGEALVADIGGRGRSVTGHAVLADNDKNQPVKFFGSVWPRTPHMMRRPPNWQELSQEAQSVFIAAWEKTPEARLYNQERCPIDFRLSNDGDFTVPDLPAGDYRMTIASWSGAPVTSRMLSRGTVEIHIPEMPSGRSDEPLDLGEVSAYSTAPLQPGDRAPYFESVTLEGQNLKLSDYAGKNVLLHFWRSDVPESLEALGHLKAARDKWGKDKRLVLIGMNFDDTLFTAAKSVATHALSWPQCFVAKQSDLPNKYRLRQPTVLLIGTDGRILQPQLAGDGIAAALEELLRAK